VRLVVVGSDVYAVKIYSQDLDDAKVDYRAGKEETLSLRHEAYQPPQSVQKACVEMIKGFSLEFGAFDFVLTPEGEHVFLELNPNGQWLWLQLKTKVPITESFCRLLMRC
jgi:hypothetical protein